MNTNDLRRHLLSRVAWVDQSRTVDTVKAGDPDRPVRTAAVGWIASIENLRRAVELGCDLFVTHEPTFWQHEAPEDRLRGVGCAAANPGPAGTQSHSACGRGGGA